MHRPHLRRGGGAGGSDHARQDLDDPPRRQGRVQGDGQSLPGHEVSQPRHPPGDAPARVRRCRLDRSERDHGCPAQDLPSRRRPVSPGELPDPRRHQAAPELHRALRMTRTLLTVAEALAAILERAEPAFAVEMPLARTVGLRLAEDVAADLDLPPFDKAIVDGFAVRSSDTIPGETILTIGETILAGQTPTRPLGVGEAAVIMTGAPLPVGADGVVMVEKTRQIEGRVAFQGPIAAGQNRMVRGREMTLGQVVAPSGIRLDAPKLGLLASVGRATVRVSPRPNVAVLPTGDELVPFDRIPGPGQIRNSNALTLATLARDWGADATELPIAPDSPDGLKALLERALLGSQDQAGADVLLVSGGVSAGQRDLVPEALASLGIEPVFHKVKVKPGKPLWFGVGPKRGDRPGALVFGLPGNPVSGIVSFLLFVRPALDRLIGRADEPVYRSKARLTRPFVQKDDRPTYHPARLRPDADPDALPWVDPVDWAGSADLRSVAYAEVFAALPVGPASLAVGDVVEVLHWRERGPGSQNPS